MHQVRNKARSQKIDFMRNYSRFFYHFPNYQTKILLGDFNAKVERERERERVFSDQQLDRRVSNRIVMIME